MVVEVCTSRPKIDRGSWSRSRRSSRSSSSLDRSQPIRGSRAGLIDAATLRTPQEEGLRDRRLAKLLKTSEKAVRDQRRALRTCARLQARRHLCRRVRDQHRLHVLDLRGRVRGPADRTRRRSWCSAAARTASAGASSSTIAACTPPSPCAGRLRDHHGQLQPRDRLDRLRYQRSPLFRAADARRTCSRSSTRKSPPA